MTAWTYAAWAFGAGVLIPVMAALNGGFGRALASPQWATVVLMGVGLTAALVVALIGSGPPPLASMRHAQPMQYAGGLIVAFYVLSVTFLAPRFGVAPTILFVMLAQIAMSALIGQFGWFGAPRQPINAQGALGLALMMGGVLLVQVRRS